MAKRIQLIIPEDMLDREAAKLAGAGAVVSIRDLLLLMSPNDDDS